MAFQTPPETRYFEDYVPGEVHKLGTVAVERDELLTFGRRFDPQDFHADPAAAERTVYQGLIASGWHTAGLMMRLYVQRYLSRIGSLGSPGVDEVRWPRPVRPDDVLSVRVTVLDARLSNSKPDRGIVTSLVEVANQRGELVMSLRAVNLFARRP